MNFAADIILENNHVLLRALQPTDAPGLMAIVLDDRIWQFTTSRIADAAELDQWLAAALTAREQQQRYTFVIVDKASGAIAGSTAFGNISVPDRRLEIGWTWLGQGFWGSGLNKACKYLLLSYAFEVLQYERVELKTDVLNLRSRKAMCKLGATEEGVLRSHTLMHDGRRRDTIYYSLLLPEWEERKASVFAGL
ncbi:GNAT family N-acetyltransferase [Pontibacter beigongshangensis]|uniref:GNAT family N-acetyltransferase n=1 Tax=Pontibacter beigongshangensis TaxID=2574733 RepID=UPI00164FD56B|nr:GNAT family protein [Pontibacter beigongshangensis]